MEELEDTVVNLNNIQKKNNLKLRGLKEGAEGDNLTNYLTDLFTPWLGADSEIAVSIEAAYRIWTLNPASKLPRDALIKFPNGVVKATVLASFWDQPDIVIACVKIAVYSNLSSITLKKCKNLKKKVRDILLILRDR